MSNPFSATKQPLVVFRGTTETLLRAGGVPAPAGFVAEDVVLTAELDSSSAKLVSRSPLLHTAILIEVGSRMSKEVAPKLATVFLATGSMTADHPILKKAASHAPMWVAMAGQGHKAGLRRWRKAKFDSGIKCATCMLGLAGAGAGLASAAGSFGATAIPAIFGAWSAVSSTITMLQSMWRDVETSQANVVKEMGKLHNAYSAELAARQGAGVTPAAAPGTPHKAADWAKRTGNVLVTGLKLEPLVAHRSLGPSVAAFRRAIDEYERKLAHLAREADKLSKVLYELLDIDQELAQCGRAAETATLTANEALIDKMIGDESGSGGVTRYRDGFFKRPVSILWLVDYYRIGRDLVIGLRLQAQKLLQYTSLNQIDAFEKAGAMLFTMLAYFGGQADALAAGSPIGYAKGIGVLTEAGGASATGVAKVGLTLNEWAGQVGGVIKALRHQYPQEAKSTLAGQLKMEYMGGAEQVGGAGLEAYGGISEAASG